eukprot:TRINITY_DN6289_c0_g1_i9.p1 TRINITY_DN6289_c0_g1~~TRINITY_DN6289_c0_g1_i9.p1  ORF type:complete len:343 (-),score=50.50 TRINITY_DN6289_c0_g1_i9:65-1093(-)
MKNNSIYLWQKKTCKLLLFLTYDITDFSQFEANKFKANLTRNVTRDVLRETMQMVLFRFERKKLEHFEEISPSVPFEVYIDKNRYMQILLNLLGNALKFTFEGHVKVHLDYESQTDTLITMVRDTGIGIEEKDVPQLFKLFGKLENSSAMNPQGVGFGLAICKRLCESLGGYINVVTKYGVGSTFTFAIKANMECLSRHSSRSPSNIIPSNISSLVIPGSINAQILNYKSLVIPPLTRLQPQQIKEETKSQFEEIKLELMEEEQKGKNQIDLLAEVVRPGCDCAPLLIVDDNECNIFVSVSYTHLRAHETSLHLVCRLLLEKKKNTKQTNTLYRAHHPTPPY